MAKGRGPSAPLDELVLQAVNQVGAEDFSIHMKARHHLVKYGPAAAQAVAERLVLAPRGSGKARSLWHVLEELGPAAASVASMLVKLLVADEAPEAAGAIASMGPAADYVMPDILRAFATASPTLRPFLVRTMRGIGTRANLVIPLLVSALEGSTGPEKVEILATLANYGRSAAAARSRVEQI